MNSDFNTYISTLREHVKKFVEDREWVTYHTPQNLIQALQIEAAELSEIFLFKNYTTQDIISNKKLLENVSDEIADVFIYLLSLINTLNIDLTESFFKKMEKNNQKYSVKEFNNGKYYKK
ncbi:MAG: nucleotide pyrophosphohydrolase [Promethearchaeota archaeon]